METCGFPPRNKTRRTFRGVLTGKAAPFRSVESSLRHQLREASPRLSDLWRVEFHFAEIMRQDVKWITATDLEGWTDRIAS
jgi:hypothetical protein